MAYLIDGNNFIGHISPLELKDPLSRYRLIARLVIFQKIKRTKVSLVFDGPPDPKILDQDFDPQKFSVIHPSIDQNADSVIKSIISRQAPSRHFVMVSSDREIRQNARAKGVQSLTCREFNRLLKQALKEHRKRIDLAKRASPPSSLEVKHWMEIFQSKK